MADLKQRITAATQGGSGADDRGGGVDISSAGSPHTGRLWQWVLTNGSLGASHIPVYCADQAAADELAPLLVLDLMSVFRYCHAVGVTNNVLGNNMLSTFNNGTAKLKSGFPLGVPSTPDTGLIVRTLTEATLGGAAYKVAVGSNGTNWWTFQYQGKNAYRDFYGNWQQGTADALPPYTSTLQIRNQARAMPQCTQQTGAISSTAWLLPYPITFGVGY